jgi:hypothetical protein
MFGDKRLYSMIASIAAMRTDNIMVDDRIIPVGWLAENGIKVSVTRELSPFKPDGTLAQAGESYHHVIRFYSDLTAVDERCIFNLPGSSKWSQESVWAQIAYVLTKHEHYRVLARQDEEKQASWQQEEDRRIAARDKAIAMFFDKYGKPASSYRIGQIVATRDGSVWKIASRSAGDVGLIPYGGDNLKISVVPNDALLVPGSKKYRDKFRYELSGISY